MPPAARPVEAIIRPTTRQQGDLLAVLPWDSWETVAHLSAALQWPDDRTHAVLIALERGGYVRRRPSGDGWRKCPIVQNSR